MRKAFYKFFDGLGGVTGKSESLIEGSPKVFSSVDHEIGWPPILILEAGSFLGAQQRVKYIAWVLKALILIFHCSK
jgi:hypothetical protein